MAARTLKNQTYGEMAKTVAAIADEVKRRNPLWVNSWVIPLRQSVEHLKEIGRCKRRRKGYDEA